MESEMTTALFSSVKAASHMAFVNEMQSLPGGKEESSALIKKYSGIEGPLAFYIEKAMKIQINRVRASFPSDVKTNFLPFAELIWSTKLTPVQIYEKEAINPTWVGESNLWDDAYAGDFNRGSFFLEYYVRVY